MNVIIFIIRVLKLLFMHGKYFFLVFALITVLASPAAGSLTKIVAGAPVYIGEKNIDISSGLQQCHSIAWWAPGADMNGPPQKNISIIRNLDDSIIAFSYTIDPKLYTGYEGKWYCEGKYPLRVVFEVFKPQISVKFWDLDKDEDVSGQTIPLDSNITYRIDTNLDMALQYKYRPDITPADSFYTVSLKDPSNNVLFTIYTGTYGRSDFQGLILDQHPYISSSPYFWKDGNRWDRASRNKQGDQIYPPGTYTITVDQNLNNMQDTWAGTTPEVQQGITEASAAITFVKPIPAPTDVVTSPATASFPVSPSSAPAMDTVPPTATKVPGRTTYSPLAPCVVLAALGIALACAVRQRK